MSKDDEARLCAELVQIGYGKGYADGRAEGWGEALEAALALDWDCGLNDRQKEMLTQLLKEGPPDRGQ